MTTGAVVIGGAALALLLVVLPGALLLRALRVRSRLAWGSAPALMMGAYAVFSLLPGVPWTRVSVGLVAGGIGAAGAIVLMLRRVRTTTPRPGSSFIRRPRDAASRLSRPPVVSTLVWALCWVLVSIPIVAAMASSWVPQTWDTAFHVNAVQWIREHANGSSLGGAGTILQPERPFYPVLFHAVVSLLPGDAAIAVNSAVLAAGGIWIAGLYALAREVGASRIGGYLAMVAGATMVAMPAVTLTVLGVLPYGWSIACLPGALAWAVTRNGPIVRADSAGTVDDDGAARSGAGLELAGEPVPRLSLWLRLLGLVAMAPGIALGHPSALIGAAVLLLPFVLARGVPVLRRWWRTSVGRVLIAGAGVLGLAAAVFVVLRPEFQSALHYSRNPGSFFGTLAKVVIDMPMVHAANLLTRGLGGLAIFALAVVGARVLWRTRSRWFVYAGVVAIVLTALAGGPDWILRSLTGPWYVQAARVVPMACIGIAVAAGIGAAHLIPLLRGAARGWRVTVAVVSMVLVAWTSTEVIRIVRAAYDPTQIAWGTMLTHGEIELIREAGSQLPDDAVVLGNPFNGTTYFYALAGVRTVNGHLSANNDGRAFLELHAGEWETDPEVCEVLWEHGVTHLYVDLDETADGARYGAKPPDRAIRLDEIDTSALPLVAESGGAALYEFDVCP